MNLLEKHRHHVHVLNGDGHAHLDETLDQSHACDVVYVIFLDPPERPDPSATLFEKFVTTAVSTCQPDPSLVHCEILIPPVPNYEGDRTSFATYMGRVSSWQRASEGHKFYLLENASRWRAVPVFGIGAGQLVRTECQSEIGVDYSLLRYLLAARPLRSLAKYVGDARRDPAHCASLTARILKNAFGTDALAEPSASYGPSRLFHELSERAALHGRHIGAASFSSIEDDTAIAIDRLLRAPMTRENVQAIGDEQCHAAVKALTMKVCNSLLSGEELAIRLSQRQLADALLRWTILRPHAAGPASPDPVPVTIDGVDIF
ncbi:MAG: hypothetical protein VW555_04490 [Luminiphilus sp.]